jgi:hypothetical protein
MQDRYRERSIVRVSITNEAVDDPSITENDEVVRSHQSVRRDGRKMTRVAIVIVAAMCLAALTAGNGLSEPAGVPVLQGAVKQRLILLSHYRP